MGISDGQYAFWGQWELALPIWLPSENPADLPTDRAYHRRIRAWSLYDVADHAVITTMAGTFFPPYFIAIAAPALLLVGRAATDQAQALARDTASNYYAFAVSLSLLIAAVVAPVIGTYADILCQRKRILVLA